MALTPFREYYLIEAVDLDRTWANYGEAVKKRAGEVKSYTVVDENGRKHFNIAKGDDHPFDNGGEAWIRGKMVTIVNDRHTYSGGYDKMPEGDKRLYHADLLAAKHGKIRLEPNYEEMHPIARGFRSTMNQAPAGIKYTPELQAVADHLHTAEQEYASKRFMQHVADSVPHPKYIPVVTRMYAEGGIKRIEDIDTQASEAFTKYHKLATHGRLDANKRVMDTGPMPEVHDKISYSDDKYEKYRKGNNNIRKPIPETNFKAFKSLDDVRAVVNHPDHKEFFQKESKAALKGQYSIVHDDDEVTVYHPHTHEASVALAHCPHTGQKAAWCTAASSSSGKEYFDDYSNNGPLLIFHPKNPLRPGEMYQAHVESDQYMDEHDSPHPFLGGRTKDRYGHRRTKDRYDRRFTNFGHEDADRFSGY